jgi:molybdopterin biosynthesis enzyme
MAVRLIELDGDRAPWTGRRGSHILTSMLGARALVIIPSAGGTVSTGARARIEPLESFSWEQS